MADGHVEEVGLRFTADGAVDYQKTLKEINAEMGLTYAEYVRGKAQMDENATASEKLANRQALLEKQLASQKDKVAVLTRELETMAGAEEKDEAAIAKKKKELALAEAKLSDYEGGLKSVTDELKKHSEWTDKASEKLGKFGEKTENLGKKLSVVSAGAAAVGTASLAAFGEVDEGLDTIITKTGASGEALDGLNDSFRTVYTTINTTAADAGIAIGEVNTRFGATGETLEELSRLFIQFATINETDLNNSIGATNRLMQQFGVDASETAGVLGVITSEAQRTGISVDTLMSSIQTNGATFQELGLSLGESVVLMAEMEANGVNAGTALTGLRKSAVLYTKEGLSMEQGLQKTIQSIKSAKTDTEALAIAQEVFGAKGALEMSNAIRSGRLSLDDLSVSLKDMESVVQDTFEATLDPPDKLALAMQNLKMTGADLGASIYDALTPMIDAVLRWAQSFAKWFGELDDGAKQVIVLILAVVAAIGPLLILIGKMATGLSALLKILPMLTGSLGPIGIALAAVAVAVVAVSAAIAFFTRDTKAAQTALSDFAQGVPSLADAMNGVAPSLMDVNSLLSGTGKTMSQLDGSIRETEQAITGILAQALSEQRALRQEDLDSIRQYNDDLLRLQMEKLQVYRDQQLAELRKLQLEEQTLTKEGAMQRLANAQESMRQTNAATEEGYTAQLTIIENKFKAMGEIGSAAYQAELSQAKAHYDQSIAENQSYYAQSLSVATAGAAAWVAADSDKWNALNSNQQLSSKQYTEILGSIDQESAKMFLQMVATTKAQGGEISAETANIAAGILGAFDGLPGNLQDAGTDALAGMLEGMESQIPGLEDMSTMSGDAIVSTVKRFLQIASPSKVLYDIGENTGKGLEGGLSSRKPSIVSGAQGIGKSLVEGIWDGINGMANWLSSNLRDFVDKIISDMKTFFGIHSPSTKARDLLGFPFAQGIAVGIGRGADLVDEAIRSILPGTASFDGLALTALASSEMLSGMTRVASAGVAQAQPPGQAPAAQAGREGAGVVTLSEESVAAIARALVRALIEAGFDQVTALLEGRELARFVRGVMA